MTPDESIEPSTPGVSDNPQRQRGGIISFTNWFKEISDWIAGFVPAGATKYDTGWIESGLSFAATSNVNTNASDFTYRMRRRGKTVHFRIDYTYIGPSQTGGTDGNLLDQPLFDFPPGWRPFDVTYDLYLGNAALYELGGRINASGTAVMVTAPPGQKVTQGDRMRIQGRFEVN